MVRRPRTRRVLASLRRLRLKDPGFCLACGEEAEGYPKLCCARAPAAAIGASATAAMSRRPRTKLGVLNIFS
jgi:hypothetical protein